MLIAKEVTGEAGAALPCLAPSRCGRQGGNVENRTEGAPPPGTFLAPIVLGHLTLPRVTSFETRNLP